MAKHKNFYETIKEARMRLEHTVVLYDGKPYYVLLVSDHKADDIFRIYLDYIDPDKGAAYQRIGGIPYESYDYDYPAGAAMDKYLDTKAGKESGIIRKMMTSAKFNNYRPFPLGMCNTDGGGVAYIRRSPTRHTQQGLNSSAMNVQMLTMEKNGNRYAPRGVPMTSAAFSECVTAAHPSFKEVLSNLLDDDVQNEGAAFDREFALLRGPLDLLFLYYKEDAIGLVSKDGKEATISKKFKHTKEVTENLKIFDKVTVQA